MSSTTQNEVAKALTSAIQTIAESNAQSKEATLTIEAEIVDVIDEGLGTYIVNYLGNKFEASTSHNEITYSVGDRVYVIVPNGNFDKNKIILSPVVPGTSTYASTDTKNTYITLGDNIFESVPDVSLCTYKPHDATKVESVSTHGFAALFKSALTDSRTFNFTCKIQTNIEKSRRSRGNYGLALYIPVIRTVNDIESKEFYTVIADTNNILGDPYNLAVPALQNFYFTLPNDMEYYDTDEPQYQPHICSFVRNFLGEDSTKPDDIFITDIQLLSTFEIANSQMEGYYSIITASGGNSFLANVTGDKKTLSVTAYLNGKITRVDRFECYWFKENASITNTSEKFQRFGGLGWEILNEVSRQETSDDGTISVQYVTNVYTQEVSQTEIHYDTKFKCVLVKDDTVINAVTTIKNLGNDAKINLISLSGSNVFAENVGNVDLQLSYYEQGITDIEIPEGFNIGYAWQRLDKNGQFIDNDFLTIDEYKRENNVYYLTGHYPVGLVNEANTIACTVYIDRLVEEDAGSVAHRQIIGTVRLTVSTVEVASGGRVVVVNGDKLYKYDADGDSPLVADYDGPLSSRIKAIDPLSLNIYKEDGSELTEHEYQVLTVEWMIPTDSMITPNETYDTEKNPGYMTVTHQHRRKDQYSLSYKIAPRYNKNKQNNNIIVRVTAPSSVFKEPLSAIANIRFLKDGESGTNGSKYSAIVTYNGYGYGEKDVNGKVHKLQLIWAKDNWYFYDSANPTPSNNVNLSVSLYADGDPVSSFSGATWKIFDAGHSYDDIVSPVEIPDPRVGHLTHISTPWSLDSRYPQYNKNYCATIEVSVPAVRAGSDGQASVTGKTEYVYAYYPIECTYSPYSFNQSDLPRLEGGFSKVLYAADGTNPQYDNSENFYAINSIYNYDDGEDIYDYEWSVSSNLKKQATDQHTCKITPKSKFDNGVSKNFVKTKLTRSRVVNARIAAKIATLRAEVSQEGKRKNYYTSLQNLLAIFKNFGYNNYIQRLTEASEFYLEKTKLAQTAVEMQKQAIQVMLAARRYMNVNLDEETTGMISVVQGTISTLDNNVYRLYLEMWGNEQGHPGKISDLSKLVHLTSKLGTDDESIEDILATAPSSLLIENKIQFREGIPARSCYFTLNSMIDDYNALVNSVYTNYFNELSNPKMTYYNGEVERIIHDLTIYVDSVEALALLDVDGCHEERYKYQPLVEVLRARLYTASKLEASSYSLMIDNVINLIKDDISKYVTFADQGGYTSTILEINNTITRLNAEIAMMEDMQTPLSSTFVIHIKPIIMTYNRYGMSNINGWDGNKVEVDGGYILSPQVGAGKKENDNSFTGIVIGVQQVSEKRTTGNKIGLFGYSYGQQSIFLNADTGSATFGLSNGGQIIIDPSDGRALIKSGNYVPGSSGMQIDLSTPEIRYGSGNFVVDKYGHITAKGGGSVAGWNITDNQLHSNTIKPNGRITLDSSGTGKIYSHSHETLTNTGNGFYLSYDGLSIGDSVRITESTGQIQLGKLKTTSKFWTIDGIVEEGDEDNSRCYISYNTTNRCFTTENNEITITEAAGNNQVYLGTDGFRIGTKFAVDDQGNMVARHMTIKGGSVGGWTINDTSLSANGIEIRSDGRIKAGDYSQGNGWEINKDGNAYFTKGTIGGWTINNKKLSAEGIEIDAESGKIRASNGGWSINGSGDAVFSNIVANGTGTIGGWTISSSGLSSANFTLNVDGLELLENLTKIKTSGATKGIKNYVADTITATYINVDHLKAGTIQGKTVGWSSFTALAGFDSSTVYRVRLADGGEAEIRAYGNPVLNQILALANVSS